MRGRAINSSECTNSSQYFHGPLTGTVTDIVATQGKHLLNRLSTPVGPESLDHDFHELLCERLQQLIDRDSFRTELYGCDAPESRFGHTPLAIREHYQSDHDNLLRQYMNMVEPATPSTSDSNNDVGKRYGSFMSAQASPCTNISSMTASPKSPHTKPREATSINFVNIGKDKKRKRDDNEEAVTK